MHCQVDAEQNQRDCQDLTQRIRAKHETKLGVRLTRELDKEAGEAVPGQENAGQQTRTAINAGTVGQNGQQAEEQTALEESPVELARVARPPATVGKDPPPRQVRGTDGKPPASKGV